MLWCLIYVVILCDMVPHAQIATSPSQLSRVVIGRLSVKPCYIP